MIRTELRLKEFFNSPKCGPGKTTFEKIIEFQINSNNSISLTDSCKNVRLNKIQTVAVENFVAVVELCRAMIDTVFIGNKQKIYYV